LDATEIVRQGAMFSFAPESIFSAV
jgi:hypothetical protein